MALKVEAVMNAGPLNAVLIGLQEDFLVCTYINVHYSEFQAILSAY